MRWQPGGNLEPMRIICETDWKRCIRAILRYIWIEVVTDVVDCLTTETTLWTVGLYTCKVINRLIKDLQIGPIGTNIFEYVMLIVICLISILLLRIFYIKRKWVVNTVPPSNYILNRVGCKVDDLELKINILSYKLQYGTWPLPHQIRNPALKKQLRNLRLTLSTSCDRNAWIKHMLLSSTSKTYLSPSSKLDSTSLHRVTKLYDTKTGSVSSEIKFDASPIDQSDIKSSSKTTSVESIKETNKEYVHQLDRLSKSENLREPSSCRVTTQLSLLPQRKDIKDYVWKKLRKQRNPRFTTSRSKITNGCDKYTESIEECKRFLRELKESNKRLELNCSSSAISNDSSSFRESFTDEKSSLHAQTTDARNSNSRRCEIIGQVKKKTGTKMTIIEDVKPEENNPETFVDRFNGVTRIDQIVNNGLLHSSNLIIRDNQSTNLTTNYNTINALSRYNNLAQMSEEKLYKIKRKLESLDNILRNYGVLNSTVNDIYDDKKDKEVQAIYQNVVDDTLDTMKFEIENIKDNKKNSLKLNDKKYNDKMLQTNDSDWELFESMDSEMSSSIVSKKNNSERSIDEENSYDRRSIIEDVNRCNYEESYKTDQTFPLIRSDRNFVIDRELIPITRNYFYRDKNKVSSELGVPMETDEDPSSIQSTNSSQLEEVSKKDSDSDDKSTEMLIREALECKKELLSRVKSNELGSNVEIGNERETETMENDFENVNVDWLDIEKKSLRSNLLDIITEESTSNSTDKTSGTYIFLQTKSSNEISVRSSSSFNMEIDDKIMKEDVTNDDDKTKFSSSSKQVIPIDSSEYFSLNDLTTTIVSKYENPFIQQLPNDRKSSSIDKNMPMINVNQLEENRQPKEIVNCDDDYVKTEFSSSSKQVIPIDSEYFSLNDLTTTIVSKYENPFVQQLPNDTKSLIDKTKQMINFHSSQGKRQHKEIARFADDDSIDDDTKRHCHRDEDNQNLTFYQELHKTISYHTSLHENENNNVTSNNIDNFTLIKSVTNNSKDCTESFEEIQNNNNNNNNNTGENDIEVIHVETEDLSSLNRTTDSSSGGSIKYQLTIDKGSMTNLFSIDTNSNLENKLSSIPKQDEILFPQDLSLKRRPGMLSFGQLKMNSVISNDNNLFQNPYFLADATLSEVTRNETIELNLIPISVSIDARESNIFSMTRQNIFADLNNNASSALRISYNNNDREDNKVTEIMVNEIDDKSNENEMKIIRENDHRSNVLHVSDHNVVNRKDDEQNNNNNNNVEETMTLNDWKQLDTTKSQCNLISQRSSSYLTGDTSSYINKIDFESYQEMNECSLDDIRNDILEYCIDSCIDLLNKKETINNDNESLQLEVVTSIECVSTNNNTSNKSSISYVDANDFQSSNEIESIEESNENLLKNQSEGFIFDGSIHYKKPLANEQNIQKNLRTSNSNYNPKSKKTNNDIKSKIEPMTYSKRYALNNNNRLKAKSNLSIIDNKDLESNCSTKSTPRPSSCNLSREKSTVNVNNNNYKNEFTSHSAVFSSYSVISRTKEDDKRNDEMKYKSETTRSKCSTSKSYSKSCIPILKSRLGGRRIEQVCRSKSPIRGPLTMRGLCRRDKLDNNDDNLNEIKIIPTEGYSITKEETSQHLDNSKMIEKRFKTVSSSSSSSLSSSYKEKNVNVIGEDDCSNNIVSGEQTIIYVNIINHQDSNVTRILDPEKFLEYAKEEPIKRNTNESSSSNVKSHNNVRSPSVIMTQEKNTFPKLVTILSSIRNEEIDSNDSKSLSNLRVSGGRLKSFWSLTIQHKEMEVSVKPSVTDTSTSMSDFLKIKETLPFHEHRIFGIPKELNNEEYCYLLEILTREHNLGYLKEIQNLCNRLRLKNANIE